MRLPLFTLVVVLLSVLQQTPGHAVTREAWLYSRPEGSGVFQNDGGARWVEIQPKGDRVAFAEVARKDGYVELYDDRRRLSVRLHADYVEWRQYPKPDWYRLYSGRWVAPDQVPPLSDYQIRLAYFLPQDRAPTANYEQKIRVLMHFVAGLYHQALQGRGVPMKDLAFQTRGGEPVVHLIRGARPAGYYNLAPELPSNSDEQYHRIVPEIPAAVGVPNKNVMIVFAETYEDGPAKLEWLGSLARGAQFSSAGGVGIFSAWILRDELTATSVAAQLQLMFDTTPIKGRTAMGDGHPDSPRMQFIQDGFGAVAHEMGHTFGLSHDCRQNARDIMCNGFRHIRWNFADPPQPEKGGTFSDDGFRLLASSRYFSPEADRTDNVPPDVKLRIVKTTPDQHPVSVTVEVEAADDNGLRAIAFYAPHQDSVVGGRWLTGKNQSFTQELTIVPPKSGELRIEASVTDLGGNLTRATATTTIKE